MQDMSNLTDPDVYKGLLKDPITGDYRVDPGYGYQANRYRIHETYLDEEDNLWIKADAVERIERDSETLHHNGHSNGYNGNGH
jgi:hypothetical protein